MAKILTPWLPNLELA